MSELVVREEKYHMTGSLRNPLTNVASEVIRRNMQNPSERRVAAYGGDKYKYPRELHHSGTNYLVPGRVPVRISVDSFMRTAERDQHAAQDAYLYDPDWESRFMVGDGVSLRPDHQPFSCSGTLAMHLLLKTNRYLREGNDTNTLNSFLNSSSLRQQLGNFNDKGATTMQLLVPKRDRLTYVVVGGPDAGNLLIHNRAKNNYYVVTPPQDRRYEPFALDRETNVWAKDLPLIYNGDFYIATDGVPIKAIQSMIKGAEPLGILGRDHHPDDGTLIRVQSRMIAST